MGNGRNRQVILDKISQTDRRFLDIKFIIAGSYTDKMGSQLRISRKAEIMLPLPTAGLEGTLQMRVTVFCDICNNLSS